MTVKVYTNRTGDLKFYLGFGKTSAQPEGFDFLFEITDVMAAVIASSAILLMEAEMTYKTPGVLEYCRKAFVNFDEIADHMHAYEVGQALKKMLVDAKAVCGTEAK